jgi:hypothetical protein
MGFVKMAQNVAQPTVLSAEKEYFQNFIYFCNYRKISAFWTIAQ